MSLVLSRLNGQSITLVDADSGNESVVTVWKTPDGHIKVAVEAPDAIRVHRTEKLVPAAPSG